MARKFQLSAEESELFRHATRRVTPLKHDKAVHPRKRPSPVPRQTHLEQQRVIRDMLSDNFEPVDIETGEELLFSRKGLQHGLIRKLRRGQFTVQAELDLHGLTVDEARLALAEFLVDIRAAGVRCVRIIHGKGYGSRHKLPVLKNKLNGWLQQRDEVLAFCSARQVDGGTGAVYVLLKRL